LSNIPHVGAPIAVAAGGLIVALFALGPAAVNATVRNLSAHLAPVEDEAAAVSGRAS